MRRGRQARAVPARGGRKQAVMRRSQGRRSTAAARVCGRRRPGLALFRSVALFCCPNAPHAPSRYGRRRRRSIATQPLASAVLPSLYRGCGALRHQARSQRAAATPIARQLLAHRALLSLRLGMAWSWPDRARVSKFLVHACVSLLLVLPLGLLIEALAFVLSLGRRCAAPLRALARATRRRVRRLAWAARAKARGPGQARSLSHGRAVASLATRQLGAATL